METMRPISLSRPFDALRRSIKDLLLPPICAGCQKHVSSQAVLCPECWNNLYFITEPYCPIMGTPFSEPVKNGMISGEALQDPPPFARARAAIIHQGLGRALITRLKYADRSDLAPMLADLMYKAGKDLLEECDVIVPIPLHYWRFLYRHYNQAAELARYLAQKVDKPLEVRTLIRKKYTKHQVGLTALGREKNLRGAFTIAKKYEDCLKNKHIVLVDDVYTTGSTIKSACQTLQKIPVKKIDVLTFSHVLNTN